MATQLQGMGLFGMPTAQEARQQYEQGLMLTPAQMGSQGLLQQVVSTIGQGGGMAGYGLGRMMGGMAPQEAEAMGMQQAMQEVTAMGITDPAKKMTALADALQKRGLSRAAMQALEKGRAMRVQDLQSQQAEAGLMELKPIKGAMRVVGQDSLGNPVYKQDIIGYQQGSRFMTPEQAEAYIKGLSPDEAAAATGAPPPAKPKTASEIRAQLERSLSTDELRAQERRIAAATEVAKEQGLYDIESGFEDAPPQLLGAGLQGTGAVTKPVTSAKLGGKELPKTGLVQNTKITQNLTSLGRGVYEKERARKLTELAAKLANATNDTERARILREARRFGLTYKDLTSGQ
jgi:hypothetical protein